MKDVYNELIAALKNTKLNSDFSCKIADTLCDTFEPHDTYNPTFLNEILISRLTSIKKAIQQTLINCK